MEISIFFLFEASSCSLLSILVQYQFPMLKQAGYVDSSICIMYVLCTKICHGIMVHSNQESKNEDSFFTWRVGGQIPFGIFCPEIK